MSTATQVKHAEFTNAVLALLKEGVEPSQSAIAAKLGRERVKLNGTECKLRKEVVAEYQTVAAQALEAARQALEAARVKEAVATGEKITKTKEVVETPYGTIVQMYPAPKAEVYAALVAKFPERDAKKMRAQLHIAYSQIKKTIAGN